jgi:hypothetical protein
MLESDQIRIELVMLTDVFIDKRFQRSLDPRRVEQKNATFDPKMIGVPVVNRRPEGRYSVVDGQHRIELLKMRDADSCLCQIVGIDERDEPVLFVDLQNRRKDVHPYDRHRALVFARHDESLAIERILKAEGFHAASNATKKTGAISAIQVLYRIAFGKNSTAFPMTRNSGPGQPDALRFALRTIREAWGLDADRVSRGRSMIEALAIIRNVYDDQIDEQRLLDKLSEKSPIVVHNQGVGRKSYGERGYNTTHIARQIIDYYNSGLRSSRERLDPRRIGLGGGA